MPVVDKMLFCALILLLYFLSGGWAQERLGAMRSETYAMKVAERAVFVEHYKKTHIARLTLDGKADVTVTAPAAIKKCRISPEPLGLKPRVQGKRLSFALERPARLVIRIDDGEPLFLFADPPAKAAPDSHAPKVSDITTSGIDATGGKVETRKIQRTIDALPAGGALYFPPGVYQTGTIRLKSDMTLWLAPGATLLGCTDIAEYPEDKIGESAFGRRLVLLDEAHNVTICGGGAIDGNGRRLREVTGEKAHLVTIARSRDVLIEGVELRDAGSWNTRIIHSDRVAVRGVKLISDPDLANTDGFDPDGSRDVLIENSFVYCGDDGVAVKSTDHGGLGRDVQNITVRGNVFLTRKSALKVGTESRTARMGDILFEDNDVLLCDRGMALYCNDGALYENIRYINNRFEECYPDAKQRMIDISISERKGKGTICNVLIQNCAFESAFPKASTIDGLDAGHQVSGIRIENLTIAGKKARNAAEAGLKLGKFVQQIEFH